MVDIQNIPPSPKNPFNVFKKSNLKNVETNVKSNPDENDLIKKNLFVELFHRQYQIGRKLGKGAYSKVYYGEKIQSNGDKNNRQPIACKIINRKRTSDDFSNKFLPRELEILATVRHKHIVEIFNFFEMGPYICICMDYCPLGNLMDRITANCVLSWTASKLYFRQICSAVGYLHSNDISHRDIKCENILLYSPTTVKLTDFGFARKVGHNDFSRTFCGSPAYAAPELMQAKDYDPKLNDMWSLGCVLFVMIYGILPFDDERLKEMVRKQLNHCIEFPRNGQPVDILVEHLIRNLLHPDVTQRYRIRDVETHDWMSMFTQ